MFLNLEDEIDKGNILMLQIPDGGASIDDLFREKLTMNEFTNINNAMINLLKAWYCTIK
jgi:hypothetical protein